MKQSNRKHLLPAIKRTLPGIYFLFVFFLYFSLLSRPHFIDELDVFFGGYHVVKGRDIYASFLSQHMPFSYYFAALIALCGARTAFQFRLGCYLLLAGCWEIIFLRHRRRFPVISFFLMPLIYITMMKTLFMGTIMVSEHWQGIGLVMIMLELIRFAEEKEISRPQAWMVCFGIVLSFGCTFASAYSLFCYFLAMVCIQILNLRKTSKNGRGEFERVRRKTIQEDLRLVFICLLPFLLLAAWYGWTNNLENCYEGVYEIVTQLYSKYIGGLGSDPVSVVWTTFADLGKHLLELFRDFGNRTQEGILTCLLTAGMVLYAFQAGQKSIPAGIAIFLATVYGGLRGFVNFHAEAYFAQAAAALALLAGQGFEGLQRRERKLRWPAWVCVGAVSLAMLADFGLWTGYNLFYPQILLDRTLRCEERILDLLTEPEEEIFVCNASHNLLDTMDLELVPKAACSAVCYPYFYEMWGERQMESIRDLPHVVLYNPEESFQGYIFREYAPDFHDFMQENYTHLPQGEDIWVSNVFLPEAQRRLKDAGYGSETDVHGSILERTYPVEYKSGQKIITHFTANREHLTALRIRAACYYRRSQPELTLKIMDPQSGGILAQAAMGADEIADDFFSRCPMDARLVPGRSYELEITVERIRGKGDMEFYFMENGELALTEEYR